MLLEGTISYGHNNIMLVLKVHFSLSEMNIYSAMSGNGLELTILNFTTIIY